MSPAPAPDGSCSCCLPPWIGEVPRNTIDPRADVPVAARGADTTDQRANWAPDPVRTPPRAGSRYFQRYVREVGDVGSATLAGATRTVRADLAGVHLARLGHRGAVLGPRPPSGPAISGRTAADDRRDHRPERIAADRDDPPGRQSCLDHVGL